MRQTPVVMTLVIAFLASIVGFMVGEEVATKRLAPDGGVSLINGGIVVKNFQCKPHEDVLYDQEYGTASCVANRHEVLFEKMNCPTGHTVVFVFMQSGEVRRRCELWNSDVFVTPDDEGYGSTYIPKRDRGDYLQSDYGLRWGFLLPDAGTP